MHPILGVFKPIGNRILRSERWTVFLAVLMLTIFVTGLFYEDEEKSDEKDESEKTFWESLADFRWRDFWICVYSMLITIPIPYLLKWFFARSELNTDENMLKQVR